HGREHVRCVRGEPELLAGVEVAGTQCAIHSVLGPFLLDLERGLDGLTREAVRTGRAWCHRHAGSSTPESATPESAPSDSAAARARAGSTASSVAAWGWPPVATA